MKRKLKSFVNLAVYAFFIVLLIQKAPVIWRMMKSQGQKIEAFSYRSLSGTEKSLPDGKRHVLVFWATWCGPCKVELARLNRLIANGDLAPDQVIAISVGEQREVVDQSVRANEYRFEVGLDESSTIANRFQVAGTPTVTFVTEDGHIDWMTTGISPSLELRVRGFMKSAPIISH